MPPNNLRELIKQGDPKVIAQIINHRLQQKGIQVYVIRKDSSLEVTLESGQVTNEKQKKALVEFIRNGMDKLGVESINTVTVYGVPQGEKLPIWEEKFMLGDEEEVITPPPEAIAQPIPEDDPLYASEEAETALEIDEDNGTPPPEDDLIEEDEEGLFDPEGDDFNSQAEFDEDSQADFDEEGDSQADFDEEGDSQADFDEDEDDGETSTPAKKKLPLLAILLPLLLLPLIVLAVLHFTGIFRLPFLGGSEPDSTTPNTVESPEGSPPAETTSPPAQASPSPEEPPGAETWANAVRSAISAANKAGEAQTRAQWNEVASEWQKAIDLMKEVPQSNPNYQTAQQKVLEYQNNLNVAKQRAARAQN